MFNWLFSGREKQWRIRQSLFEKSGTRYYGDGGTIHNTGEVDVEVYKGRVVSVWFRCQALPFHANYDTDEYRAKEMDSMYLDYMSQVRLHGVEVSDETSRKNKKE